MKSMPRLARLDQRGRTETVLSRMIGFCKTQLLLVGLFSGMVNLLQLSASLYTMQIFDRVITTHNVNTLIYLSLIAGTAILLLAILEFTRNQIMQRLSTWVELKVAPEGIRKGDRECSVRPPLSDGGVAGPGGLPRLLGSRARCRSTTCPGCLVYSPSSSCCTRSWASSPGRRGRSFRPDLGQRTVDLALLKEANTAAMSTRSAGPKHLAQCRGDRQHGHDAGGHGPLAGIRRGNDEPQQRAAQRGSVLVAASQILPAGSADRDARRRSLSGAAAGIDVRGLDRRLHHHGSGAGAGRELIGGWKQFVQVRQAFSRLQTFLRQPRLRPPGLPLPEPTGSLSVERVTYAFPGRTSTMIKGVQFALNPGESLAIIGPSAAGKSTLIRMLIGTCWLPAPAPSGWTARMSWLDAGGFRPPCRLPAAGRRTV